MSLIEPWQLKLYSLSKVPKLTVPKMLVPILLVSVNQNITYLNVQPYINICFNSKLFVVYTVYTHMVYLAIINISF